SKTGSSAKEEFLDFWGNKSYLKRTDTAFEHYIVTTEEKYIGGGFIPIRYVRRTYNEVAFLGEEDIESATSGAEFIAFEQAAKKIPENARIVGRNTEFQIDETGITATVALEYEIEIGVFDGGN
ncbi:MAG: sporulation protein YqfD, partial [Clostridia bacterium]|nr:sporulation protein YqfD [Clostridia bacterium]